MEIKLAKRIETLPPYLFARIDELKTKVAARGVDIISFGIGDPDTPTPDFIINAMDGAVRKPENHVYPSYVGMLSFRQAVADWYDKRFQVKLDPQKEVVSLIGSKEGIAHLPLALIDPGDIALIPDPGYPVYGISTTFAGGIPYNMPLLETNGFLPDLDSIPEDVRKKAKIMFLNYPNNPTAATADHSFFERVVEFAQKNNIIVCHDAAYSEIYYEGQKPPSFLEVKGAKDVGIEFHSLSKTFNMTGWRIGWAVGNSKVIGALGNVKTNIDSGIFQAIQEAGIAALKSDGKEIEKLRRMYQERREVLVKGLRDAGLNPANPNATFYVWMPVPNGYTSESFSMKILEETGVVITPGNGFGPTGEGYVRFSITVQNNKILEAIDRIKKSL